MSGSELQVMVVEDHGFQRRIALRLLSELGIERVLEGGIDPGLVFDLTVPLDDVAEGYRAMDERRAVKVLVRP